MKLTKKLIVAFLTLALTLGCIPYTTTEVQAALQLPPSKMTLYFTSTSNKPFGYGITIAGQPIDEHASNIKSTNKNVLEIDGLEANGYDDTIILFTVKKLGTAAITYTIGDKKYQTKIQVKKYTNPVKSVTITGIKNGKSSNLVGLTNKNTNSKKIALKKTVSDPKIQVTAKKGWKIMQILYKSKTEDNFKYYEKPVSKATLNIFPKSKLIKPKAGGYRITVVYTNTKNKATLSSVYNIDTKPENF